MQRSLPVSISRRAPVALTRVRRSNGQERVVPWTGLGAVRSIPERLGRSLAVLWLAALTGFAMLVAPNPQQAAAEPDATEEAAPPPFDPRVPSSPPVTATFQSGLTLTVTAAGETQIPLPQVQTEQTNQLARDVIVGGTFNGSSRGPAASGTLAVGYEVTCGSAPGPLAALLQHQPTSFRVPVTEGKFTGAAEIGISGYYLHIDQCMGPAFVRSYAILTATTGGSTSVVAYYGIPHVT